MTRISREYEWDDGEYSIWIKTDDFHLFRTIKNYTESEISNYEEDTGEEGAE